MNVLFLSSSAPDREHVIHLLSESGHQPVVVDTAAQAGTRAQGGISMILVDLAAGAEALRFLRQRPPGGSAAVVCIADRLRPDASSESLRLGVADIIARPVGAEDLRAALANGQELSRLAERALPSTEPGGLAEPGDGVFGASPAMREVIEIVRRVAQCRCGVLIVGERGTGREMIARAIHAQVLIGLFVREVRRRFREGLDDSTGYWLRLGAVTGLVAIALQEIVEFSLQMPGNAVLFVLLCGIAARRASGRQNAPHGHP